MIPIGKPVSGLHCGDHFYALLSDDGTLSVIAVADRWWYKNIGIDLHSPKITVYLPETEYAALSIKESTGDIILRNVIAAGEYKVERSAGGVIFDSSDTAGIFVKTSTGDVIGSLRSEKVFIAGSSTGDVSVPKTASGGKCEIITSTGDINIEIN